MNTHYEPTQIAAEKAEPQSRTASQSTTVSAEGQALDEARAEFRAAWQAKLDRKRGRAETLNRVATWSDRLVSALLVLCLGGLILARVIFGVVPADDVLWVGALGIWGCNLVHTFALVASHRLKRSADRLEAVEIRHP